MHFFTCSFRFRVRFRIFEFQAERRLSPDYVRCKKALYCTSKTHRCLHAAHAYTGNIRSLFSSKLNFIDTLNFRARSIAR